MKRNILLLEPNYKNKYPPLGLMKISTYHRSMGDKVTFFKGNLNDLVLKNITLKCIKKLLSIDNTIDWHKNYNQIFDYIKRKNKDILDSIPLNESKYEILLYHSISDFADYFRKKLFKNEPEYDRVYVATLFTFYWNITIETIEFAKLLVKNPSEIYVGGVMASLLPKEIYAETGITPITGLLDKPGQLDKKNKIIIDDLPLDYSILDEIDYDYPTRSAYFTFMTKGCTRKCAFCSVPKIEPSYKPFIKTKNKFKKIKTVYGEQQNLLLMDNNVLASPNFKDIIKEIKSMGFVKGARYAEPNQLDIAIKNLASGTNDPAFIKRIYNLIHSLLNSIKDQEKAQYLYNKLDEYELLEPNIIKKENIIGIYDEIKVFYEKNRLKNKRNRYVDFNQGVDCRYIDEETMKLISEIPIRPLRIAFDYIGLKKQYENAVRLAAKYGITELSNYILYNFSDKPEHLYERLKTNIHLCSELGIHIYSFPMKYIPLYGEDAKHREYLGPLWNRKYIRTIQAILNVTKGIVAPGRTFFEKAFGSNLEEFNNLLYMPEDYIIYRKIYEEKGLTADWQKSFNSLSGDLLVKAKNIIEKNDFTFLEQKTTNKKILKLLAHYKPHQEPVKLDKQTKNLEKNTLKLIKNDQFIDLTLTYDFESDVNGVKSKTIHQN